MKIPPIDSFSNSLPELRSKKAELHVEINQRKAECAIIRARIQVAPSPGNQHESQLLKLLGRTPVAIKLPDTQRLGELLSELDVLNAGVSILDKEILKETRVANNKLIESVRPEINRLGNNFAKAFAELHARHLEYDQYIDDLEDVGASVGQFRIRPNGLSHPKDRSGNYFYALQELIDSGYLSNSNMPKALR